MYYYNTKAYAQNIILSFILLFLTKLDASLGNCCCCLWKKSIKTAPEGVVAQQVWNNHNNTAHDRKPIPIFQQNGQAAILYPSISIIAQKYEPTTQLEQDRPSIYRIYYSPTFPPIN